MSETKEELITATELPGTPVTKNICLGSDGKYRWVYEFKMLKNPTILITTVKVMILAFAIVMGAMLIFHLCEGVLDSFEEYWNFYKWMLVLLGVLLVISVIAYLVVAANFGWKYLCLFTMDENGVENRQMKQQFDKAQAMGWLAFAVGIAGGNYGAAGAGLVSTTRDCSTSDFHFVRKVKSVKRRQVIYVNQLLNHNQVYAEPEDFDFVRDWIVSHCPRAKVRG